VSQEQRLNPCRDSLAAAPKTNKKMAAPVVAALGLEKGLETQAQLNTERTEEARRSRRLTDSDDESRLKATRRANISVNERLREIHKEQVSGARKWLASLFARS
jgi:hypothetical protein